LSDAERERYQAIPTVISSQELLPIAYLSLEDRQLVSQQRREVNRLGFALQLVLLRWRCFLPEQWWKSVPVELTKSVARQLDVKAEDFTSYGYRQATVSEHFQAILVYLQLRRWQPNDIHWFQAWLMERALEHDQQRVLLELGCRKIVLERIIRPSIV
jgi:TnpA family transposase